MGKKKRKRERDRGAAPPPAAAAAAAAPPPPPSRRFAMPLIWCLLLLWVFAYTPAPIVFAAVPGMVGYLLLVERARSLKQAVLLTFAFGSVATGIGYRWLAPTVQLFGGVPPVASWVLVAIFGAWNTMHGVFFALIHRRMLRTGKRPHPLLTVVVVVACETLPIRMFGWMTGHGAIDVPGLAQAAEWGGVPAVSFVLLCLVVPLHEWLRWLAKWGGPPPRPRAALATFLVGVAFTVFGAIRVGQVRGEEESATNRIRVAIVQGNVGSVGKRQATRQQIEWRRKNVATYERQTRAALAEKPELIVWPETAVTDAMALADPGAADRGLRLNGYGVLNEAAAQAGLLVGMYEQAPGPGDRRFNVAALRAPGPGPAAWTSYRKVYLIPFGEEMPFGLFEEMLPQEFKMLRGEEEPSALEFRGMRIVPFICYEAIIPDHVRGVVGSERPDLLVNLTNDSWFGDTWEPHQHLNFTRFRAIEHRAPLVRATNTGISAFVSATGSVESELGVGAEGILVHDVALVPRGRTVYERFGHGLPWLAWAVALGAYVLARRRTRGSGGPDAA